MGSHGGEHIKISRNDAAECSETNIEIKIKTLDCQTVTLRVDKSIPVPELKEKAALVTGIQSDRQRLIFQGKLLRDDQLLSAYNTFVEVEDGHTLHLVVKQPVAPSPESSNDHRATDVTPSTPYNLGNQVGPSMIINTFGVSETENGASRNQTEIVSAGLDSSGATSSGSGGTGIDLNQPPPEQLSTAPGLSDQRIRITLSSDQEASTDEPVESPQPLVMPDSLTTLSGLLTNLMRQLVAHNDSRNTGQHENNGHDSGAAPSSSEPPLRLDVLAALSAYTVRVLEEAAEWLSELVVQLDHHESLTDAMEQSIVETTAARSGPVFQHLGALLAELGRAITAFQVPPVPMSSQQGASIGTSELRGSVGPGMNIEISTIRAVLTRRRVRIIRSQPQGEENAPPVSSDDSSSGGGLRLVDSNSENTTATTTTSGTTSNGGGSVEEENICSTNTVTAAQLGENSVQTQDGDEKADDEGCNSRLRPQPSSSKRQRSE